MTETLAESCRFTYDLGVENIYTISGGHMGTGPGTFLPAMIRIHAPDGVLGENSCVNTFDRDWELKRLDFGDGTRYYVVDDQENAVVFLPAAYAQTHIQCKPIGGNAHAKLILKAGQPPQSCEVPINSGLLVLNDDVEVSFAGRLECHASDGIGLFPRFG